MHIDVMKYTYIGPVCCKQHTVESSKGLKQCKRPQRYNAISRIERSFMSAKDASHMIPMHV